MISILCLLLNAVSPLLNDADTPELFLKALAEAPAVDWAEFMTTESNLIEEDSVRTRIESFIDLSVEPGEMILEDSEGGYTAFFPESRWTWRLTGGIIGSVTGESVIEWRPGGYRWRTVPLFTEEGASVGPKETMCAGVMAMSAVILLGSIAVWYAKRRYS